MPRGLAGSEPAGLPVRGDRPDLVNATFARGTGPGAAGARRPAARRAPPVIASGADLGTGVAHAPGMNIFQNAEQLAIRWLKEMMTELGIHDPHDALHALR